jgi:putative spermidine/putrescine transport system ATP-binding protein
MSEPMHGAAIQLLDLEKRYGDVTALAGVSLDMPAGEFVTLLGPSGSGKTTTLNAIAGFLQPDNGRILVDRSPIETVPPHRRNIGMVFQNYALFPHMTVEANIAYPLKRRKVAKQELRRLVAESLALVGLDGMDKRYPRELSGGQQQRVALARALVFRPRVLLMDEPLGALDRRLRASLQLEFKRIHRELGITFVYVTHDQEEALTMSDRLAVMDQGRILQVGSPRDIYERPAERFVADFIGETNFIAATVIGTENGTAMVDFGSGRAIAATLPDGMRPAEGDELRDHLQPVTRAGPVAHPGSWVRGAVQEEHRSSGAPFARPLDERVTDSHRLELVQKQSRLFH